MTEAESLAGPALVQGQAKVTSIVEPEHAVAVLKATVAGLHGLVNNVGHYSSLAFNDVEQAVADIRYLTAFIRSKV